jgi:hypothetical protein
MHAHTQCATAHKNVRRVLLLPPVKRPGSVATTSFMSAALRGACRSLSRSNGCTARAQRVSAGRTQRGARARARAAATHPPGRRLRSSRHRRHARRSLGLLGLLDTLGRLRQTQLVRLQQRVRALCGVVRVDEARSAPRLRRLGCGHERLRARHRGPLQQVARSALRTLRGRVRPLAGVAAPRALHAAEGGDGRRGRRLRARPHLLLRRQRRHPLLAPARAPLRAAAVQQLCVTLQRRQAARAPPVRRLHAPCQLGCELAAQRRLRARRVQRRTRARLRQRLLRLGQRTERLRRARVPALVRVHQ